MLPVDDTGSRDCSNVLYCLCNFSGSSRLFKNVKCIFAKHLGIPVWCCFCLAPLFPESPLLPSHGLLLCTGS